MTTSPQSTGSAGADDRQPRPLRTVLTVFLPFAGGYFLSYLFRSVNAIIAPDLIADIGLSATDLGLLTSAYLLAFAAFQMPLGLLLDRFGPRRVQSALLLSAAVGALVFAAGEDVMILILGRALIGLGVAGGLMTSFKAIVLWFPPARWPLVNGWFLGAGGLGALAATAPVEALLHVTDWRGIFVGLSALTVLTSSAIFLIVPERRTGSEQTDFGQAVRSIGLIYRDRLFWQLAPMATTTVAAGMAFQGLWAGPWLKDVAGFDREGVAMHMFLLAALLTLGFVLCGAAADVLTRRGYSLTRIAGAGTFLLLLSQVPLALGGSGGLYLVLAGVGLLANVNALLFPVLSAHFSQALSGRSNTALNTLLFAGAFAAQYAIGAVIDLWPPLAEGAYQPVAYRVAFGAMLVLQVLSWLWFLWSGRTGRIRGYAAASSPR